MESMPDLTRNDPSTQLPAERNVEQPLSPKTDSQEPPPSRRSKRKREPSPTPVTLLSETEFLSLVKKVRLETRHSSPLSRSRRRALGRRSMEMLECFKQSLHGLGSDTRKSYMKHIRSLLTQNPRLNPIPKHRPERCAKIILEHVRLGTEKSDHYQERCVSAVNRFTQFIYTQRKGNKRYPLVNHGWKKAGKYHVTWHRIPQRGRPAKRRTRPVEKTKLPR